MQSNTFFLDYTTFFKKKWCICPYWLLPVNCE